MSSMSIQSMSALSSSSAADAAAAVSVSASASASSASAAVPMPVGGMLGSEGRNIDVQQLPPVDQTQVDLGALEPIPGGVPGGEGASQNPSVVASAAKINSWFNNAVIKLREFFERIGAFLKNIGVGVSDAACWVGRHTFGTLNAGEQVTDAKIRARNSKDRYLYSLRNIIKSGRYNKATQTESDDLMLMRRAFLARLIEQHMRENPDATKGEIYSAVVGDLMRALLTDYFAMHGVTQNSPDLSSTQINKLAGFLGIHQKSSLEELEIKFFKMIGDNRAEYGRIVKDSMRQQPGLNNSSNTYAFAELCQLLALLLKDRTIGIKFQEKAEIASAERERDEYQELLGTEAIQRQAREALSANDSAALEKLCRQDRNGVQAALLDAPDRLERFINEAHHLETLQAVAERSEAYLTRLNTELARKRSELKDIETAIEKNSPGFILEPRIPNKIPLRNRVQLHTFVESFSEQCLSAEPNLQQYEIDEQQLPIRRKQIKGDIARIEGLINAEKGKHPSLTTTQANSLKELKAKINLLRGIASIDSSEGSASTSSGSLGVARATEARDDDIENFTLPPPPAPPAASSSLPSFIGGSSAPVVREDLSASASRSTLSSSSSSSAGSFRVGSVAEGVSVSASSSAN